MSTQRRKTSVNVAYEARLAALKQRRKSSLEPGALEQYENEERTIIEDEELLSEADRKLARMGYKQVYEREFSWMSCISFALAISGLYASVTTTYIYPLYAGGAASAVWSWLISGAGCMCIALSVSELVSAYPTCGGIYFTCKYLAPDNWVPEISWLTGWLTIVGQIAGFASTEYGTAQLILAAVSMNSDFTYLPTTDQTVGVMVAISVFHGAINSMKTSWLEKISKFYVVFHVLILVSCCIVLLVMCKDKHTSAYVWTDITPASGWTPKGFSFLFGFLSVSWTMTDYDATAHIAEEIKNPEIKAPWAITIALGFTYVAGWLFTIVLTYCSGDIASLLTSPIDQPVAQLFYNVMGRQGGVFYTICAAVIFNTTGICGLQGAARALFAVARDEMLPGHRIWKKINDKTHTPLYAVWLIVATCIAVNLIALGSYVAIAAIFSVTAIAYDWSYCIPIICKMSNNKFEPGPFHLGKLSWWINLWAVLWTAFASIIFVFPEFKPVTPQNMNYACLLLGATFIFSAIYWYAGGRNHYIGPRVEVELIQGVEPLSFGEGDEVLGKTSNDEKKT